MSHTLEFRPEAERELEEAVAWYESQQPGLGDAFLNRIETALERISDFPLAGPAVHDDVRRHLLDRFPHSILYIVEETGIVIVAIFHGRRDPSEWKR